MKKKELLEKVKEVLPILEYNFLPLADTGYSSAEAAHLANLAGAVQKDNVSFFQSIKPRMIRKGDTVISSGFAPSVSDISEKLDEHCFYSLEAYLKVAISLKNELLETIKDAHIAAFNEELQNPPKKFREFEYPEFEETFSEEKPVQKVFNEFDFWIELGHNELAKYLAAEAEAAYLGKLIHPNGPLYKLYNESLEKVITRDNGVTVEELKYDKEEVENLKFLYFQYQQRHRDIEKEVNSYKQRQKDFLFKKNQEESLKYKKELEEFRSKERAFQQRLDEYNEKKQEAFELWRLEKASFIKEHNDNVSLMKVDAERLRNELLNGIAGLKIHLPESLREILNSLKEFINE